MMTQIDRAQAQALAALVGALRPDWDTAGVMAVIGKARDRGDPFEVAHAALYAAADRSNRTPAVIAMSGTHWSRGRELSSTGAVPGPSEARCDDHPWKVANNCGACAAEDIAVEAPRVPVVDEDRIAMYERGARRARAALDNVRSGS